MTDERLDTMHADHRRPDDERDRIGAVQVDRTRWRHDLQRRAASAHLADRQREEVERRERIQRRIAVRGPYRRVEVSGGALHRRQLRPVQRGSRLPAQSRYSVHREDGDERRRHRVVPAAVARWHRASHHRGRPEARRLLAGFIERCARQCGVPGDQHAAAATIRTPIPRRFSPNVRAAAPSVGTQPAPASPLSLVNPPAPTSPGTPPGFRF